MLKLADRKNQRTAKQRRRLAVEPLENRRVLASHMDAPLLPSDANFRGSPYEEWGVQSSEWTIASGLGEQVGLSDTVKGVRFLPGAFDPGETEFEIVVSPGTGFVVNSFFVFGELYDNGAMDDPSDPILDLILETTNVVTTLDGEVILEGATSELDDHRFGPTAFDEPIFYADPQPRGPNLNAVAAKFVVGTGGMLPPLSRGEHTLVNEIDSLFFGQFKITYDITVSPNGKAAGPKAAEGKALPFNIRGGGPVPFGLPLNANESGPHQATGTANFLGRYSGEGTFTLGELNIDFDTGAVTGTFQGTFDFVAANGDRLATTYGDGFSGVFTGQLSEDGLSVLNVEFDAFFKPDPANSTGRFADIIGGGWDMLARADSISLVGDEIGFTAPFEYVWSGSDVLVFKKKSK